MWHGVLLLRRERDLGGRRQRLQRIILVGRLAQSVVVAVVEQPEWMAFRA